MRHVPSVYFPIFICCSPVNITGICLFLQKSCHKGFYLETSVASPPDAVALTTAAEALLSLPSPLPNPSLFLFSHSWKVCTLHYDPDWLHYLQSQDTQGTLLDLRLQPGWWGLPVIGVRSHLLELLQLGARKAACQEGHHLRRAPGPIALLSLRLETRGWYLT